VFCLLFSTAATATAMDSLVFYEVWIEAWRLL
jgi:hypothetical protein